MSDEEDHLLEAADPSEVAETSRQACRSFVRSFFQVAISFLDISEDEDEEEEPVAPARVYTEQEIHEASERCLSRIYMHRSMIADGNHNDHDYIGGGTEVEEEYDQDRRDHIMERIRHQSSRRRRYNACPVTLGLIEYQEWNRLVRINCVGVRVHFISFLFQVDTYQSDPYNFVPPDDVPVAVLRFLSPPYYGNEE